MLWRGLGEDLPTFAAAAGAEVDDPVCGLDDVEIVLDDDEGIASIAQTQEDGHQGLNVGKVQAGGRFVEDVERVPGAFAAEFGGELDALGFAARERCA